MPYEFLSRRGVRLRPHVAKEYEMLAHLYRLSGQSEHFVALERAIRPHIQRLGLQIDVFRGTIKQDVDAYLDAGGNKLVVGPLLYICAEELRERLPKLERLLGDSGTLEQ